MIGAPQFGQKIREFLSILIEDIDSIKVKLIDYQ